MFAICGIGTRGGGEFVGPESLTKEIIDNPGLEKTRRLYLPGRQSLEAHQDEEVFEKLRQCGIIVQERSES